MAGAPHTPGPWHYGIRDDGYEMSSLCTIYNVPTLPTEDGKGQRHAYISARAKCFEVTQEQNEANGHLMAAAPDLLAGMRIAVDLLSDCKTPRGTIQRMLDVIAKAEGRS